MTRSFLKKLIVGTLLVGIAYTCFVYYKTHEVILTNYPGARLGDALVSYSKAKVLAYKYKIPFASATFPNSENFALSQEPLYRGRLFSLENLFYKIFAKKVWLNSEQEIVDALKQRHRPLRLVVHQYTRLDEHVAAGVGQDPLESAWISSVLYEQMLRDPELGKQVKTMLQPLVPVVHHVLPKDRLSVAVHLRKGGGFDPQLCSHQYYEPTRYNVTYKQFFIDASTSCDFTQTIPTCSMSVGRNFADQKNPDKFPPEQYYVDSLTCLSDFFDNAPMYVYLFTDDQDPVALTKQLEKRVGKQNILFACRTSKNSHDTNVIDDWYAMAQFDCLIRSGSHFSYTCQFVGNHKVIVYPLHTKWVDDQTLVVDKVGVTLRDHELDKRRFGARKTGAYEKLY